MRRIRPFIILAVLLALGGAYVYYNGWPPHFGSTPPGAGTLQTSGTLESRSVAIVAEVGGQLDTFEVREGDVVTQGALLAQIDPILQDAQIARAQAAVDTAQAQLAQAGAGARAEQIQLAQATLDKSIAAREGAQQALNDIQAIRGTPQDIDAQLIQARGQLHTAESMIPLAETQLRTAKVIFERYQNVNSNDARVQAAMASAQVRAAEAGLKVATLTRDGAQATLDLLLQLRDNPLALNAQVHAAQARLDQAQAALNIAQAGLDGLNAGPTAEQIAIAGAQVQQALAALDQLRTQRAKMSLRAPAPGIVTAVSVQRGENVQPGAKLMSIANLDEMRFTLYVPETQIGRIKIGQKVQLKVDGLPDRQYEGQVYFISPQAEFTPATVQTADERAKTVFMVKARLANGDHTLKPGMYAEAVMQPE
jgi:HlyD family secretion protein